MLKVENLNKFFNNKHILKDINCKIEKNEKIAIIGPSGSGKSTFLRCLNLLEQKTSGKIFLDGEEITNQKTNINNVRKKINMVFQYFNLFHNKTVLQNIILGPIKLKKIPKDEATSKALALLKRVGLEEKKDCFPHQLSGGQQQRIAIIRSIAMDPEIILFDEPTSSLDPEMVDEVLNVLKDLTKSNITMIVVTHEINFAKKMADRIFFMCEGKILEQGSPEEIFNNKDNERLKSFLKKYYK